MENAQHESEPGLAARFCDRPLGVGRARPLFLIGAARSGTTALVKILNAHPRLVMTSESAVFMQVARSIANSRIGVRAGLDYGKCYHREWADHLFTESRGLIERYYAKIASLEDKSFDESERGDEAVAYYGEKHPHLSNCLDYLEAAFGDARYIHIVRDPRDSALSIAKMGNWSFRESLKTWATFDNAYSAFVQLMDPGRVYLMKYEELVSDYVGETTRALEWLGVGLHERVVKHIEKFSNSDAHTLSGAAAAVVCNDPSPTNVPFKERSAGRWHAELSPEDATYADEAVGNRLDAYGYPRASDGRSGFGGVADGGIGSPGLPAQCSG